MTAGPLRLFVAAYPPPQIAAQLVAQLSAMQLRGLKVSLPDQVHLTLQFIGDTDPRQLDDVQESIRRAASGLPPANIAVLGLISLPERGRARLVAAELEPHPTLLELHRRLALRLATNTKERSRDRFLPHMTLGRYTSAGDRVEHALPDQPRFDINEVSLMQSLLRPDRAEHRVLATFPLR